MHAEQFKKFVFNHSSKRSNYHHNATNAICYNTITTLNFMNFEDFYQNLDYRQEIKNSNRLIV